MTIDELAATTGTTTRWIRSLQTQGLLPHPHLQGRTGMYDAGHLARLRAILQLQAQGFSLQSLALLFEAHRRGESLSTVLGVVETDHARHHGSDDDADEAERYGFAQLQAGRPRRRGRPVLAVVPTTVWGEPQAS